MYGGGSLKFGRGGGGRGGGNSVAKRNSFPPPPPQRPPSSSSTGRLPLSSRKPSSAAAPPPSVSQSEESFSLVPGDPLSFAAIIRLAPDLVDEIKRVESQGGAARIKFDSNPNNPPGNVIDVNGKEFRFTWSNEMGGLCDIYEERQSGEDGNGLLVESGCSWRKLNVQRVLDESTKKHVKKRSEEYEQKSKSRKAIVLDQCNPSMKSQIQALAAAEASPWKFKPKNKRFFEPSQVGGQPKLVKPTTGFSSTATAKGRRSTSPLPSPQGQSVSLSSAAARGTATESQTIAENPTVIQARAKENAASSENDFTAQVSGRIVEAAVQRDNQGAGISDLQNMLVTLLKDNPKGMSIKALEKAVGDSTSNFCRKIEPILKKIATYEPPGRYILKSGVELESLKRSYSDRGSCPEDNSQRQFVPESNHVEVPAPDSVLAGKSPAAGLEEQVQIFDKESNTVEKIDASHHFSDLFGDDEAPDHSKGQAIRSNDSESGSDSDSGSSDSGSDSASRSRSRSPAGSGSASSSDSEGDDSSSNSKEASDVDVDIMSDDDKESKKLQVPEHGVATAPVAWSMPEPILQQDGRTGDQDGYASEDVDIENDFLDDNEAQLTNPCTTAEQLRTVSPDHDQHQPCNKTNMVNEREDVEDEFQRAHHSVFKSGGKSKRGSNVIEPEHDADHVKRSKANTTQSSISRDIGSDTLRCPLKHSADIDNEGNLESYNLQMSNQRKRDDSANANSGLQRGYNYGGPGKMAVDSLQSGRRPPSRYSNIETTDKAVKNPSNMGADTKFQETNAYTQEGFFKHENKGCREAQDEEDSSNDKANGRFKESPLGQKQSFRSEAHHKKHSERDKKSQSLGTSSRLQTGPSLKDSVKANFDRSPADKRRLQREMSDLELGELREPLPEEPEGNKRKFERVGSFKQSETKVGTSGPRNAKFKGKPASKPIMDLGNTSSPNVRGAFNNSDSLLRTPDPYAEDNSRPHGALQSQLQQSNKAVDHSRLGHNEAAVNQGTDVEGYGETQKKSHINSQNEDSRKEIGSHKAKGNKSRKSNTIKNVNDRRKNVSNIQGRNEKRKRRGSSSDENASFSKYEKEEPELKGPIKSFSQYKEYVQEYCEKYDSYCSLINILEGYRNEFQKLGMDLDSAKVTDTERYHDILAQLRESYSRCGVRHKRLKKIFLVLHEELKHLKQMMKDFAADYMRD